MLRKDKRGISPLIATVLIIGFTVILAFIIITWINSNVDDLTCDQSCNADGGSLCQGTITDLDVEFIWTDTNEDTIKDTSGIDEYIVRVTNLGDTVYDYVVTFSNSAGSTINVTEDDLAGTEVAGYSTSDYTISGEDWSVESTASVRVIPTVLPTAPSGCDSCGNFECAAIEKTV
jgi:flagellin-like protein